MCFALLVVLLVFWTRLILPQSQNDSVLSTKAPEEADAPLAGDVPDQPKPASDAPLKLKLVLQEQKQQQQQLPSISRHKVDPYDFCSDVGY